MTAPAATPAGALATSEAERDDLRALVRAFARDRSPLSEVRRVSATETGFDPALWSAMGELGLPGLLVPAEFGGAGCGLLEAGIVLQEMGRALLCAPYLSCAVLAVTALLASGDTAAQAELLPRLAAGELLAAVAVSGPAGRPDGTADSLGVRAVRRPGGAGLDSAGLDSAGLDSAGLDSAGLDSAGLDSAGLDSAGLDGEACYVVDGHVADVLIVAARDDAGIGLFAVRGDAPGLDRAVLPAIDGTRKLARLQFRSVPARPLGTAGSGAAALSRVLDVAVTALAAEAVGGAEEVLDLAIGHARQRVQFGRPIGSFQAVKHKCAELFVVLEGARVALDGALRAAAGLEPDPAIAALVAALQCSAAFTQITREAIQVLGGIGFTWEHPAHLYFRRAHSSAVLFGGAPAHRAALADRLRL